VRRRGIGKHRYDNDFGMCAYTAIFFIFIFGGIKSWTIKKNFNNKIFERLFERKLKKVK